MRAIMWRAVSRPARADNPNSPEQDRLAKARTGTTRGIKSAERLCRFVGGGEGKAHDQTLAGEQRRRQAIVGTRVRDDTDALEKSPLLKHWPRSADHATHDRVMSLGEGAELLKELPRTSAPSSSKRGPSTSSKSSPASLRISRNTACSIAGGSGLRKSPQRLVSFCGQARWLLINSINSSRVHSPPSNGVPRTCGGTLIERGKHVPQFHHIELDRASWHAH